MIGIDEVGRGAIAGPLLVCAVRLHGEVLGLRDSKLLTKNRRQLLAQQVYKHADIGYGWVSADEIDDIGLSKSLVLATAKALEELNPIDSEEVIIDGNINFAPSLNSKIIIKADQTIPAVSAASIVAKVTRDAFMVDLSKKYPGYDFEKHVGYGTKQHMLLIKKLGLLEIHRKSFKIKST